MENKDIAEKIVRIAESIVKDEESKLTQELTASDYEEFFAASDELEEVETILDATTTAGLGVSDDDEEDDTEEITVKDIAATLLDLAKDLTEE